MSPQLISIVVFLLLTYTVSIAASGDNTSESFFKLCAPTRCGKDTGPIIRYPFRLNTQPAFCGREGYELSCSANETLLHLPFSGDFWVREIYYPNNWISITTTQNSTTCPIQNLLSFNRSGSILEEPSSNIVISNCSERVVQTEGIYGPLDCLSNDVDDHGNNSSLVYVMDGSHRIDKLPIQCSIFKYAKFAQIPDVNAPLERWLKAGEIFENYKIDYECLVCERAGKYCGFNSTRNETICSKPQKSSNVSLIVGTSIGGGTILLALAIFITYRLRKSKSDKITELQIEKFLENYKTLIPTRYTFTEIKQITSRFQKRLGQGGYGSVYQGKLPNGMPVALKVLENSKGNEKEFVNEVSTISRIHHVNVVHLVGFCYEGTRRVLIYEFMSNGSLDKFIFSEESKSSQNRPLSWEILQQIATGVAHGIEYLHQGCNQRILHFDIKPHNILLDQNFQPKVSDFGLAKLYAKNQSIVSLTRARGTAGHMAPELFSRNFGEVSYKSDVYSFGMLLLKMVEHRKNDNVSSESENEVSFPERIYDKMSEGKELGLQLEVDGDDEISKKLAMVGVWCIQMSPTNRPSMTKVVQMLEGELGSLEMPPRPFLSSNV